MIQEEMPEWCETQEWCALTVTAEIMGRKWHPIIIHRLLQKPMGFNELQREIHHISDKVLSDSLEDLQRKNIIEKEITNKKPKEVEYSLTQIGESLSDVIEPMFKWGQKNASLI